MKQVKSTCVTSIQKLFSDSFNKELSNNISIDREQIFEFFKTSAFIKLSHALATEVRATHFHNDKNIVLQPNPTPRIFCPKQHGTSFHTDHMYGHGKKSKTIWVPLYGATKENSFSFLKEGKDKCYSEVDLGLNYSLSLEKEILCNAENVDIGEDEYVIFSSTEIHGSPENKSDNVRYSFDFRMAEGEDETSNKPLHNYFQFNGNSWSDAALHFQDKNYLKYICGSKAFSTRAQHVIINATANEFGLNVVGQEAELERFGFPMLEKYLNGFANEKKIDSLIVASLRIFNMKALDLIKDSEVHVFVATEERYVT